MKKRLTAIGVLLLLAVPITMSGDLEPPGPPASTMVTLQEVYDRVSASRVGILKTGQTTSYSSGDDGEYQAGVSGDARFTDNVDGTVTDNLTRLIWLQDANCFGVRVWTNALSDANTLADGSCGLTDGSVAGDWRLPNVRELDSLIDYGEQTPAFPPSHPFSGVQTYQYWSSTTRENFPVYAWRVDFNNGGIGPNGQAGTFHVWPVRDGQ